MSTPFMIRRTRWDLYVDALAAGQRWWSEERPTQQAGTEAVDGVTTRVTTTPGRTTQQAAPPPQAAPAPAQASPSINYGELEQLGKLHADGTLTDEEFAAAKAKILGG